MSTLFSDTTAEFPPPRDFQRAAMLQIAAGLNDGHKNQLVMAPTGAGKTYLGLRIAQKGLKQGKRVTFLCDRKTLIQQTSEVADEYGLSDHGVIQADHPRQDWGRPLQIASVQTVMRRGWPKTDVLIVDEAHTQHEAWVEFAQKSEARVIGLSATPFSPGLGKIFTNLVKAATMHELTQQGILVPMRVLSCRRPDMAGAKVKSSGEWADSAVEERGMEIIGDVVAEWMRHASNEKTIVFGATIKHCEELCRQFNEVGVMAATFTEETSELERPRLLKEFRKPDSVLRVLISVEALAKGFDVKDVGCVVDCRPLRKSLSTAIQMWGRGLRESVATGKTQCLLLDHSGNITRFAEDFSDIFFNGLDKLDDGEKLDKKIRPDGKDEKERTGCPKCQYKPFRQRCMACGHEIPSQSLVTAEAGEMHEVFIGKTSVAQDKEHLWHQICSYARQTAGIQKKSGFAYVKFKEITGRAPPHDFSFDRSPDVVVGANLKQKLRGKQISEIIARKAMEAKLAREGAAA